MKPLTRFVTTLAALAIAAPLTSEPAAAAPIKFKNLDVKNGAHPPNLYVRFRSGAWRVDKALFDLDVYIRSKNQNIRRVAVQPGGGTNDDWIVVWSGKEKGLRWKHLRFDLRGSDLGTLRSDGLAKCTQRGTGSYGKKFRVRFAIEDWRNRWDVKVRYVDGVVRCNT